MMINSLDITITGELWGAFLCIMAFSIMVVYKNKTLKDLCVRRMLLICTFMLISDAVSRYFDGLSGNWVRPILYVSNYLLYAFCYLIVAYFIWYLWQMIKGENEPIPVLFLLFWGGIIVSGIALTIGVFSDLYFYIDEANLYHRTNIYIVSQLITILGIITLFWATVHYRKRMTKYEIIASSSYFILPPLGTLIQAFHYGFASQQFGIAIATLVTFFVREADVREKISETTKRELENKKDLQEKLKIISALSQEYTGVFLINCDDGSMKILKLDGNQNAASIDNIGISYDDFRKYYLLRFALPEYSERLIYFSDLDHLMEYFNNGNNDLLVEYRTKPNLAGQTNFEIHVVPFLTEESNQIIFGSRCIDKRVSIEEKNREIIGSLAKAYFCMYYIDLESGEYRQIDDSSIDVVNEVIQYKGKAADAFKNMSRNLVVPEQAAEVLQFTDISTVSQRLQNQDTIGIHFLGPHVGWCEGLFVSAKRDSEGHCTHVLWGVRSIKQEKEKEEKYKQGLEEARDKANAANKAKTSFLFNMSHDIRTPMNAIIGYTDLIEKYYDDKERCLDYLHKTQQSNRFLLSLINDILEMARIESGQTQLEEEVTLVGEIAQEISDIFEDQMQQKGINYTCHIDTHTKWAFHDQAKVREIYLNILSNALKYTPAGGSVSMNVDEIPWDKPGYIKIKAVFSDTGIGMSKEFLPHLFESFARERSSTESRQQGTGLGMPIVKKILDLMGGSIHVESELGKGSTFTVTYPLRIEGAVPDKAKETPKNKKIDFTGRRVLLVEDNDLNAEIAEEILSDIGFLIDHATDGQICIEMLKKAEDQYYDVILMDIQMPNMNGYEATKRIRSMNNSCKNQIPIIAMTANAFESDKQNALNAGMNGHIAKPIEIHKLIDTLTTILE